MEWVWFQPEYGPGSLSEIVSHSEPVVKALRKHANAIGERAQSNLDTRAVNRSGAADIVVVHGVANGGTTDLDSYVYLHDPENKAGALSIENGHYLDDDDMPDGFRRWVDGLHPLRDAVNESISQSTVRS